jgi:hypothetical protein
MEAIITGVAKQERVGLFSRFALMRNSIDAGVSSGALVSWDGLHNTVDVYDCVGRAHHWRILQIHQYYISGTCL